MDVESLIRTLRAYGASVDATAVRAALDSEHDTALRDWVSLHVAPDTLLSVDELNQYSALEKAGVAEKLLTASADMAAVQPFAEHEIRNAIVELKRSTEAISKQTEALKQQHEAVNRLVNGRRKEVETRASLEASHWQTWDAKRRDLLQVVEELSQGLDSRIAELEQRGYGGVADVKQTADALFHSDDKLLSSLQKLGWELETEDPEEQDNVVTLRETCARSFTVETVRTKLDRIYLESLDSSMRSGATRRVSADDVSALQEELESLYAEILPVAQMSVEQQFLEPALKNLAARRGQGLAKSEEAVTYMDDCLDYLMDHTGELSRRVEAFQAYQTAAAAVVDVAKAELASTVDLPTKKERRPTVTASPTRRRKSSGHGNAVSPVRARAQPGRRRSSGAGAIGDEPPLEELLRTLAITAPQDESEAADIEAQVRLLASTLAERRGKAEDVGRNVQQSFESAASSQIADAKLAVQLVRDSILAESPFGEVRLVDPEIEGSLAVLAQELENVNGKLEGVNAGLVKIKGKSAKRDEIISRWGS